jgi:hypothetical protein
MEHGSSLPRSQETATGPYPEPGESSPHPHTQFLKHAEKDRLWYSRELPTETGVSEMPPLETEQYGQFSDNLFFRLNPTTQHYISTRVGNVHSNMEFIVVSTVSKSVIWQFPSFNDREDDEIKSRLNSGSVCYYSVQNLLSSHLISKNLKIKIHKTVILPVVLYGCETWSVTLGNTDWGFLRTVCWGRNEDGSWRKLHNDELHNLYFSPNIVRVIK